MTEARILVVCTANVCRSPVVERLLARHLGPSFEDLRVTSAGTHGGRLAVHEHTVRAAREVDVDLTDHASRLLTEPMIVEEGADLVVTMTREHLRDVVGQVPDAWPRSFTLKELVRRALDVPIGVDGFDAWVRAASDGRRAADLMVPSADDDLSDPYGGPFAGHVAMVGEVDRLVRRLAQLVPDA
ncbi:MAG: hypothetical protein QNJ12_21850 [Ilumatobacter sp.]|uniref:arsenate reductase/protein-tyrosine-phosphatase family protein n=1 Tax=Ilumatobacter sp. TaxID=1967498 RepID=UPI002614AE12|nr:hypothetical protein [Ilumatobacter sp.]MDJ0771445.1 hypothetical protein [Ilumatobacter sp.]